MFTRYWRQYPWAMQLFLYMMMLIVMLNFFQLLLQFAFTKWLGIDLTTVLAITESSSRTMVNYSLLVQLVNQLSLFVIPALLFAYLTHPRMKDYLGLRAPGKSIQWLWVLVVMVGALPVLLQLGHWMRTWFHFGDFFDKMQAQNDQLFKAYLNTKTMGEVLLTVLVMAVIPGLGEELTFRGIVMRFFGKRQKSLILFIGIPALLFALLHLNPYGFLSVFLAGALLGYIYYLTGSLWCSIAAHIFFNATQIVAAFYANTNPILEQVSEEKGMPIGVFIAALVVFVIGIINLKKVSTPLPHNWADDFSEDEKRLNESSSH